MAIRINFKPSLLTFFIALTAMLAFTVVTIIPNVFFYMAFLGAILSVILLFKSWHLVDRKLFIFLGWFLLPSLIGVFSYPVSMILEGNVFNYYQLKIFGRLANLTLLFVFILLLHSYIKTKDLVTPFRWYWLGTGLLMLTALWQFADVYLNLLSFPFDTRAHVHSTYGDEYSFSKRLTGIASEPSYFVMLAIDFIILSALLSGMKKRFILLPFGILLMLLSVSPSGYIAFFMASALAYFFSKLKYAKFKFSAKSLFLIFVVIIILATAVFYIMSTPYFEYIYRRITDPRMLKSARAYMNYMPFVWAWDSNSFSFLFGHGIKSYSIIGTAFNVPDGNPVHVTSNNLYVDTFWEAGLLGLVSIISFFSFVFYRIFKSKNSKLQVFIAFFVLFELMFTSVFRADFASFRFFILLYLIFILIQYDLRKIKGFYV